MCCSATLPPFSGRLTEPTRGGTTLRGPCWPMMPTREPCPSLPILLVSNHRSAAMMVTTTTPCGGFKGTEKSELPLSGHGQSRRRNAHTASLCAGLLRNPTHRERDSIGKERGRSHTHSQRRAVYGSQTDPSSSSFLCLRRLPRPERPQTLVYSRVEQL